MNKGKNTHSLTNSNWFSVILYNAIYTFYTVRFTENALDMGMGYVDL